jgi:phage tail sheath protein FI
MNILAVPGATIDKHSSIINTAIDIAETRGDCFVIADPVVQGGSVSSAIAAVNGAGIDSNYVGTYWPWVKILDTDKNKPVWVPPSVVLPGVLAYNDSVSFEWFAPAGLNRGGIGTAVDVESRLSFSDRDALYAARINPIASFPNQGICVWGQKTLQSLPSALDRINVRRLLIALKKYIASSTRYLVFDNNTNETRQRFLNIVNPYLEKVKSRQGLYAFQVVMDETNNTPDVIDRNIMYGQIYLQPAKAAEFIVLDFNVLPTGATFTNA